MLIEPVDQYCNLFAVKQVVSTDLINKILSTPWLDLEFKPQQNQETWPRRLILEHQLPWLDQWQQEISSLWPELEQQLQVKLEPYAGSAFWVDEPGFTCSIHTDGEMPGSLHLFWIGSRNLATTFYNSKQKEQVRYQQDFVPNTGYAMINLPNAQGYRHLQWHGMLDPVPDNSFRLTSYSWLIPRK